MHTAFNVKCGKIAFYLQKKENLCMLSIYFSPVAKKNVTSLKPRKQIYLDLCFYFEEINSSPLQENIKKLLKHAYNSIIIRKNNSVRLICNINIIFCCVM